MQAYTDLPNIGGNDPGNQFQTINPNGKVPMLPFKKIIKKG